MRTTSFNLIEEIQDPQAPLPKRVNRKTEKYQKQKLPNNTKERKKGLEEVNSLIKEVKKFIPDAHCKKKCVCLQSPIFIYGILFLLVKLIPDTFPRYPQG